MTARVRTIVAVTLLVALTGCGAASQSLSSLPEPRDGRSGLKLSGTFEGRTLAVSDGLPRLVLQDCRARHDIPAEVCFASRSMDGSPVVVGLANAEAIASEGRMEAAQARCATVAACREVTDHALVFVRVDDTVKQATGGSVSISELRDAERYVGELRLRVGGGRLSGTFDVVPRPDPEAEQGADA